MNLEVVKLFVAALTPLSIYVAYKAYRSNLQKQAEDRVRDADRELLAQAQKSLEWAYNVLTNDGATIPPAANRLNWLTCSRHLLRHRTIADRIQSDIYKTVHAEHEEFWRYRFYLALNHNELAVTRYYEKETSRADDWPENIEISSALVIVRFSNWPNDMEDPTNGVDRQAILNEKDALVGRAGRGLQAYVRALDKVQTRIRQPDEA